MDQKQNSPTTPARRRRQQQRDDRRQARPPVVAGHVFLEKLAHFDREVIPERRMHAKGSGAYGTFTLTNDITAYTRASIFAEVGKKTDLFVRFSTVAGERGAADASATFAALRSSYHTDQGNWDLVGNTRRSSSCATRSSSRT
jgi:catalase